jgi:hypothetical protein
LIVPTFGEWSAGVLSFFHIAQTTGFPLGVILFAASLEPNELIDLVDGATQTPLLDHFPCHRLCGTGSQV